MKTFVGLKFIHGELHHLQLFCPDRPNWEKYNVNVTQHPEGTTSYKHPPYGYVDASTVINVDETLIHGEHIVEAIDCVYEHRRNLLIINAKPWEVINKFTNCTGLYDSQDSLPAAAVLQSMALEIHYATEQGTAEIMNKASVAVNAIIISREISEKAVQDFETFAGLLHQALRHSARGVIQNFL